MGGHAPGQKGPQGRAGLATARRPSADSTQDGARSAALGQSHAGRVTPVTPNAAQGGGGGLFAAAGPVFPLGPVSPALQETGGTVQRITYKDALTGLDPLELPVFRDWIAARSPGAGTEPGDTAPLAVGLLLTDIATLDILRAKMGLFDQHRTRAATHDATYETNTATTLHGHLTHSAILTGNAPRALSLVDIQGALHFHDDAGFAAAHLQAGLAENPQMDPTNVAYAGGSANWNYKISQARKIDQTLAFEAGGDIHLRQGDADMHVAIHELIHKLSAAGIAATLGPVLNEALTEMIARDVCGEEGVALTGEYYSANRNAAQSLLTYYGLNAPPDYYDVYFRDPNRLANLLQRDLGVLGLAVFVRNKDAGGAVNLFRTERNNESQRQVLAGVLLENTLGAYIRIPAAAGRAGKTLRQHVEGALHQYARATKFKKSPETLAAIAVLQGALGNHAQLYAAVSWYLNRVQIQPPTVAVGTKLNNGSRFHTMLTAEFNQF